MPADPDHIDISDALKKQGLRPTAARRSVFELLERADGALSAAQIEAALRADGVGIDLVTVYRTLDALERCSLVMRAERMSEGWRYTIRSRKHTHSIVCSDCGSASPLDVCGLARIEQQLEQTTGFSNISHALQFYGTCPTCRK